MTRDELKCHYLKVWQDTGITLNDMLDIVIDDLESRTCENCKYMYMNDHTNMSGTRKIMSCSNFVSFTHITGLNKDFGCNKWESK